MRKVSIDGIEPGMKLVRPIISENGMVLLPESTELTDQVIGKLKNMNVEGVYVEGMSKPEQPIEEVLRELDRRFEKVEGELFMDVLKKVMREHLQRLYE